MLDIHRRLNRIIRLWLTLHVSILKLRGVLKCGPVFTGRRGRVLFCLFFRLEKKLGTDRWTSALRESDSTVISDPDLLCSSFASFYSSLFTASVCDVAAQDSLLSNITSTLSSNQADLCEGPLTIDECHLALLGMAKRKAPGLDGLPMEFYVKFWDVLGSDLVRVLNSCYDLGSLSLSQPSSHLEWSSIKIKGLGLFFGPGNLEEDNWRPRITAVENVLASWK